MTAVKWYVMTDLQWIQYVRPPHIDHKVLDIPSILFFDQIKLFLQEWEQGNHQ